MRALHLWSREKLLDSSFLRDRNKLHKWTCIQHISWKIFVLRGMTRHKEYQCCIWREIKWSCWLIVCCLLTINWFTVAHISLSVFVFLKVGNPFLSRQIFVYDFWCSLPIYIAVNEDNFQKYIAMPQMERRLVIFMKLEINGKTFLKARIFFFFWIREKCKMS